MSLHVIAWFRRLKFRFRVYLVVAMGVVSVVGALAVANALVVLTTRGRVFDDVAAIPANNVAVVLGTSPYSGYCQNRLDAARRLYEAGKVKHILVSGDNSSAHYDEPSAMKQTLVGWGIPGDDITCDFAGLRTLDSMIRARHIFGQHRFTVVSQRWHDYRALFIARRHGIDAVAFAADDPMGGPRQVEREWLARVLAVVDLYVLRRQPRYLGEKEPIDLS